MPILCDSGARHDEVEYLSAIAVKTVWYWCRDGQISTRTPDNSYVENYI